MIYPVTPNGVEHPPRLLLIAIALLVIYPVTPNGVEHNWHVELIAAYVQVIYPVTPNGVEHTSPNRQSMARTSDLSGNA